jgi:uncharacterized DUF497 family protein
VEFEWDTAKSAETLEGRGFDFRFVTYVFFDPYRIEGEDRRRNYRERRVKTIGEIDDRFYAVVFTRRRDRIRIISARRANESEIAAYRKSKSRSRRPT